MKISIIEPQLCIEEVVVDSSSLKVELSDGRSVTVPLVWYPRLVNATTAERNHWELIGDGQGIHWPDLDEDLSLEGLLNGRPSFESPESFQKWISRREASRVF
jgi:hypothetical protein